MIVDIGYADFRALSPPEIAPTEAAARNIIAQFPADAGRSLGDFVDTSILDDLRRGGVFAKLRAKYGS
jgi:hypothetical protein